VLCNLSQRIKLAEFVGSTTDYYRQKPFRRHLKNIKLRHQEKSKLSRFFFGKAKANKKIKTPPGAATVAAHADVFFLAGLRLPLKKLRIYMQCCNATHFSHLFLFTIRPKTENGDTRKNPSYLSLFWKGEGQQKN
jgi:hypothetical protein